MATGIAVYTSNRLEDLCGRLAAQLEQAPLAPLETETIVVPGQGMARWLQLQLAERHGIAAGLDLPFPGAFLQQLCRTAATGPDPFGKNVLVLRLWRLLGDEALQRDLGPAADYCRDDADGSRRWQLCERLAACFDDYQLYRDDLLLRAARGDDLEEFGAHGAWQARLWRALLRDAGLPAAPAAPPAARRGRRAADPTPLLFPELGAPGPDAAPPPHQAHRLQQLRELLADAARARAVLPPRLTVFGATTLPPAFLDLLLRIAAIVPVELYVPQPTPEFVGDFGPGEGIADGNALLARLGTESREFADLLVDLEERAGPIGCHWEELGRNDRREPATLLACVQQDVATVADRGARGGRARFPLRADDDSLRVHDCHSEQRELEVVRDQILDAFARDPRLEPHEVLVLVPDIATYAPYAHAVFGPLGKLLPFHVADKSPASEQSLCASLLQLLGLARERLFVHDVLHLLEEPAMQRRFGLSARDLPLLRNRCERAGIRWGRDGAWRERTCRIPAFEANSWRQGLDRLVLGAATGPGHDLVLGLLPAGDATGGRDLLLARFCAFTTTLFDALEPLGKPRPFAAWADVLDALLATFYRPSGPAEEQAAAELQRAATALRATAAAARATEPVSLAVLRVWLLEFLRQRGGATGFLGGAVTVAAMLPMRTVPVQHLFVCGLSDRRFPRRDRNVAFDLVARQRRPGDRSARLDDRQLFLDALLAARRRLHLTFVGRSQKDDSPCAPSVVLAELLDVLDRSCTPPPGHATARDAIVVRHPLQPWSHKYLTGDDPRLFTYATGRRAPAPAAPDREAPWADAPLPKDDEPLRELSLDALLEFWKNPSRWFVNRRLGARLRLDEDKEPDTEAFTLDGLDRWRLEDALVRQGQRPGPPPDAEALAHASGVLPVGGQGAFAFASSHDTAEDFLTAVRQYGALGNAPIDVVVDGVRIHGEIDVVGADAFVFARIAKVKPKDRVRAFVVHVLAALARHAGAELPNRTVVIGKGEKQFFAMGALGARDAAALGQVLLDGYREGQAAPLPFFELTSHAYGEAMHKAPDEAAARAAAQKKWLPTTPDQTFGFDGLDADVALCLRGRDVVDVPGFAAWAKELWGALLTLEKKP